MQWSRDLLVPSGLAAVAAGAALVVVTATPPGAEHVLAPAAAAPSPAAGAVKTDARGFLDSAARCPDGQTAVAIGHTQRSLVVVCTTPGDGPYEYRGVRVSDGALLKADAKVADGGFVADADGVTYTVTPKTLTVVSGGKVIYRDTWIDFQQPRFSAESGASAG
ncbi:MAG TPA: hypothetical protein VFW21_03960 [Mycobacterium sp.]|nr:hypothetical protein [Mycobacterium sp.]